MGDISTIKEMTKTICEGQYSNIPQDLFNQEFDSMTIEEIRYTMWKLYCFMSDVQDTLEKEEDK